MNGLQVAIKFLLFCHVLHGNIIDISCMKTSQKTAEKQAQAVRDLLQRLIPARAAEFLIEVDFELGLPDKDTFRIESESGKILISGSRGYAAASGVHYYLKYFCGSHISWSGNQLSLPGTLPPVHSPLEITTNDKYRYYQNVCTASYSFVWWNWTRWEREIDWMALNGINLPLSFTGQEGIWRKVFRSFNFTDHDIDEFFTGPAFLAWNRMGNIQGWAGSLSDNWHFQQNRLQKRILERMRNFGMTPVLPAFSGRVPSSIRRIYPNATVTVLSDDWGHFAPPYGGVLFLQPTDPLFKMIGTEFLSQYIQEFGTDHIYNADLFNEMPPPANTSAYLAESSKSVFQTITTIDSSAIWLIQNWMIVHDPMTWGQEQVKAFVTAVPKGKMIILDLQSELFPQYEVFKSYYGQPFIWCMLHNYGGVTGLYGSLNRINTVCTARILLFQPVIQGSFEGRQFIGTTMIGTGITPEGIETNDVVYEFMNEMGWRKHPVDINKWIVEFATRRYGSSSDDINMAWLLLRKSVYNASALYRDHGNYILTARPSLRMKSFIWYDPKDVMNAWRFFINATHKNNYEKSETFQHDLVDVTRQALQVIIMKYYDILKTACEKKDVDAFKEVSDQILGLYDDLEILLASDIHFLLGPWTEAAKSLAHNSEEMAQFEYNARNQITLWGPGGQILDYANKQWSGVVSGYYKKRWKLFLEMVLDHMEGKIPFNQTKFNEQVLEVVEIPFTLGKEIHPIIPTGQPIEISRRLLKKYEVYFNLLANAILKN